ncbi:MAG TPA: hypothetical protein VF789_05055 [Thermoanaerobaculia bacterium]
MENKSVDAVPDWIVKQYSPNVCATLTNWIHGGLTFTFSTWADAIRGAEAIHQALNPVLDQKSLFEQIKRTFSNEISQISVLTITGSSAKEKAMEFARMLAEKQKKLQRYLDHYAPDYVALVRFYVKDHNVGKIHPGINSWAFLEHRKNPRTPLSYSDVAELARSHMLHGHDVDSDVKVIKGSPLVSASEDVERLLEADSPYNAQRGIAISEVGERRDNLSSRGRDYLPIDRRKLFKTPVSATKPKEERQVGKTVSDRIVNLTYGHTNLLAARNLQVHVATHAAFLVVPRDRVFSPPQNIPTDSCCILEKECTIFAPNTDVSQWVVAEVSNRLPELTGRRALWRQASNE